MINRYTYKAVKNALFRQAAVALLGPRQVGKTTLAIEISKEQPSVYLDLENVEDRDKLSNAGLYLSAHKDKLIILDEIHRVPELFQTLRGLIDEGRRQGRRVGQFLLLGSASMDLLRQSGESLAGRITYVEMSPLNLLEVGNQSLDILWVRGGFPDSFSASNDIESLKWREDFIRSYLERDIPQLGPRVPSETLRRLWMMLAHSQGTLLNAANLAAGLGVSGQTISRYIDLLVDLLLVRRLAPYHDNTGKRMVKSPKIYIRDSGITHALLNIADRDRLLGHPVVGGSFEGFVIETLLAVAPQRTLPSFYRTSGGAEIDLLLELPDGKIWAIEIKLGLSAKVTKGFYVACADIKPSKAFVVYSGQERYPLGDNIEAISLYHIVEMLTSY